MEEAGGLHKHVLETLPVEIRTIILCKLDSFTSLECCIFRFPSFYDAFESSERRILFHVYSNSVPNEAREAAMAVSHAEQLRANHFKGMGNDILDKKHFINENVWIVAGETRRLFQVVKMQRHVEWFTTRILRQAMIDAKRTNGFESAEPRTTSDVANRIQLALYRYQFLCSLSVKFSSSKLTMSEYWLHHVAACQMDELACVFEYLWQQVTVIEPVLLDHSDRWQKLIYSLKKPRIMSFGLIFLAQLLQARTNQEQEDLLHFRDCKVLHYFIFRNHHIRPLKILRGV